MDKITFNKDYIVRNGKPWFPIMGEFHYSRYPQKYWKESLYKMKAGGVQICSTYCIWIHHEEIEGEYDFLGDKDLRSFVEVCKEVGIELCLRIGPWAHGEVRNGGFPDWLLKKGFELRGNDENYLQEVEKYYKRLFKEVDGLFLKDGGPIVAVQIENEYGHAGGAYKGSDPRAEIHMQKLKEMAIDIGFEVPLYTATGWGGAATGGMLPVMGGYCDAPWANSVKELEPSGNYIFTIERNDKNIGSDHSLGYGLTFDTSKFPYLTAELGGGLQVTRHRRTVPKARDISAISLVKMGSGCNLLGYYMYHGGTNPFGKLTTLNETKATGYPNDLSELNYDFRAPIKEYGQISDTFKELKLLTLFANDFGDELCKMPVYISSDNPLKPTNYTDLRYSVRHNGQWGFVFVNNYQRKKVLDVHKDAKIKTSIGNSEIEVQLGTIENGEFFFYPIKMPYKNGFITEKVTPLCKINDEIIFYGKKEVEGLICITREEALNSWKISKKNKEQIVISNAPVIECGDILEIYADSDVELKVYPDFEKVPKNFAKVSSDGLFAIYKYKYKAEKAHVTVEKINENESKINLVGLNKNLYDVYLDIDYMAESADLYLENKKVADEYYAGEKWQIGLRKFDFASEFILKLEPLIKDAQIYFEEEQVFDGEKVCEVKEVSAKIIEKIVIDL